MESEQNKKNIIQEQITEKKENQQPDDKKVSLKLTSRNKGSKRMKRKRPRN
jgi:hypothetical protein